MELQPGFGDVPCGRELFRTGIRFLLGRSEIGLTKTGDARRSRVQWVGGVGVQPEFPRAAGGEARTFDGAALILVGGDQRLFVDLFDFG